jgi:predicted negative regulator of RcsB-dependent stress response
VADRTEEEQVEVLKNWIKENGVSLVVSIAIVLTVVFGYRMWQTQTLQTAEAASSMYEELVEAITVSPLETISEENLLTGKFLAGKLKAEHAGSTYAQFAALHLAKLAMEDEDLPTAVTELQWVLDNGAGENISIIANLRLARVKFGLKEYENAITQLASIESGGHESSVEELRGDIYYAMGRTDESREAYQRAVNLQANNKRPMTQMKLEDLVAPKVILAVDDAADDEAVIEDEEQGVEES